MNCRTRQVAVRVRGLHRAAGRFGLFAQTIAAWLLASAAAGLHAAKPPVELKPDLEHLPALAEVAKDIGVRYAPAFGDYVYAERFAVGPASVRLLDGVFQKVFRRTVELKDAASGIESPLDALIVPSIHDIAVNASPPLAGRWWFVWCHLTYRFTVSLPGGRAVTAWDVTGSSETLGDLRAETLVVAGARALTRCMEDAGIRFMRSFYDVPEARRWARNLAMEDANASPAAQVTQLVGDGEGGGVEGLYRGVAKAQVRKLPDTDLGFKVTVESLSVHRLLIDRATIAIEFPGGKRLKPAPVYAYAAARLEGEPAFPYFHIPPPPISLQPSYFAFANLISALILLESMETEKKALDTHLEKHRGAEFRDQRLPAGAVSTGDVYFGGPPRTLLPRGSALILPIVDLDTATRHEFRLPLAPNGAAAP